MVNIPLVQINSFDEKQYARQLNQVQRNIIDGIKQIQQQTFNASTVIGQEITAYLTESQFQDQAGTNWVLADGRNITGSAFAKLFGSNTLPDRRGTVSRMMDNGAGIDPAGDLPLGTYQADEFESHTHVQDAHAHTQVNAAYPNAGPSGSGIIGWANFSSMPNNGSAGGTNNATATNQSTGSAETRVKAIIANVFVRIN